MAIFGYSNLRCLATCRHSTNPCVLNGFGWYKSLQERGPHLTVNIATAMIHSFGGRIAKTSFSRPIRRRGPKWAIARGTVGRRPEFIVCSHCASMKFTHFLVQQQQVTAALQQRRLFRGMTQRKRVSSTAKRSAAQQTARPIWTRPCRTRGVLQRSEGSVRRDD